MRPYGVSWQRPGIVMRGRGARPGAPTLYGNQRCMTLDNLIVVPAFGGMAGE